MKILQKAVEAWYRVTECPVEDASITNFREWGLKSEAEQVALMLDLDPTGVSAYLLLKAYFERYLTDTTFSALDLITKPEIGLKVRDLSDVRDLLSHPDVQGDIDDFVSHMQEAVLHYGAKVDESLFQDVYSMAVLRRDAILAINKLRIHQFTQGTPAATNLGFNPFVYEFWNIQSLVRAMQAQPPGISLCLIRDPEFLESYFVFAIANGENLTVLVDKDKDPSPAYRDLNRRPDKEFLKRADRYHFPYELLKVHVGPDQKTIFKDQRTELVPIQSQAVQLEQIKNLRPETVLWLTMMFDLILSKFGKEQYHTPELSYTADMVQDPYTLVGESSNLVLSGGYKPLVAKTLTNLDLTDAALEGQWAEPPISDNDWMLERYADQVPQEVLNLLGKDPPGLLELERPEGILAPGKMGWDQRAQIFKTLDPLTIGTEEELRKDRLWLARYNQTLAIQRIAKCEFEKTESEVLYNPYDKMGNPQRPKGWFVDAVSRNQAALLEALVREELISWAPIPEGPWSFSQDKSKGRNLLRFGKNAFADVTLGTPRQCLLTGKKVETYGVFVPEVAEDLALICGISVESLPWQLRHWSQEVKKAGNHILRRIDPKGWVLQHPWRDRGFRVCVYLSPSAYNAERKRLGLPKKSFPGLKP